MKVTKENNDGIKNEVTPLVLLTANVGIRAVMEESASSFISHFKAFNNYSNFLALPYSGGHRNSGMVTKEHSRSR